MQKSTIYLLISILFLFSNCRKLVQDEFPGFEQKTTINSIFGADSILQLHLSTTNKMSHDSLSVVENAEVHLFKNDVFIQKLNYTTGGIYLSTQKIEPQNTYRCEVDLPNKGLTTSSCFVPKSATLKNVLLNPKAWIDSDGMLRPSIMFTIKNDTTINNYYEARINVFQTNGITTSDTIFYITGDDTIIIYAPDGKLDFRYEKTIALELFTNESNSDITKIINFSSFSWGTSRKAYRLELRTISYAYFKYAQSFKLYEKGRYPEFGTGTIVPYNLYSNIQNGYGIFAAYATTYSDTLFAD